MHYVNLIRHCHISFMCTALVFAVAASSCSIDSVVVNGPGNIELAEEVLSMFCTESLVGKNLHCAVSEIYFAM